MTEPRSWNRDLSVSGNLAAGVVAFLIYLGATLFFTTASMQHALVGAAVVGVLVFAIAFGITRMVGSFGGNTD